MNPLRRIRLTRLNEQLVCAICTGYFVEATTIIECLHTFCKTCIVLHLQTSNYCPVCDVLIHKTKPLQYLREDKTLQDIVYKLVPGLFHNEMVRRAKFYLEHPEAGGDRTEQSLKERRHFFHVDDQISLSLEFLPPAHAHAHALGLRPLRAPSLSLSHPPKKLGERDEENDKSGDEGDEDEPQNKVKVSLRRYLQCPAAVQIRLLEKFIREKYRLSHDYRVDIVHGGDCLSPELTLLDVVYMYKWTEDDPLNLQYTVIAPPRPLRKRPRSKMKEKNESSPKKAKLLNDIGGNSVTSKNENKEECGKNIAGEIDESQCDSLNSSRDEGESAMVIDESVSENGNNSGELDSPNLDKENIDAVSNTTSTVNKITGSNADSSNVYNFDPKDNEPESNTGSNSLLNSNRNSSIESLKALVNRSNYPGYSNKPKLNDHTKTGLDGQNSLTSKVKTNTSDNLKYNQNTYIPKVPTLKTTTTQVVSSQVPQNGLPSASNSPKTSAFNTSMSQCSSIVTTTTNTSIKQNNAQEMSKALATTSSIALNTNNTISSELSLKQSPKKQTNQKSSPNKITIDKQIASPNQIAGQKTVPLDKSTGHMHNNSTIVTTASLIAPKLTTVNMTSVSNVATVSSVLSAMPSTITTLSPALLTPMTAISPVVPIINTMASMSSPSPSLLTPRLGPPMTTINPVNNAQSSITTSNITQQRPLLTPNPRLISNSYRANMLSNKLNGIIAPSRPPIDPTKPRLGRPPNASRLIAVAAGRMGPQPNPPRSVPRNGFPQKQFLTPKAAGRGRPKGPVNSSNRLIAPRMKTVTTINSSTGHTNTLANGGPVIQNAQKEPVNNSLTNMVAMVNGHIPDNSKEATKVSNGYPKLQNSAPNDNLPNSVNRQTISPKVVTNSSNNVEMETSKSSPVSTNSIISGVKDLLKNTNSNNMKSPKTATITGTSATQSTLKSLSPPGTKTNKSPGKNKSLSNNANNIHSIAQTLANKQLQQKTQTSQFQEFTNPVTSSTLAHHLTTSQLTSALGLQVPTVNPAAAFNFAAYMAEAQQAAAVQNMLIQTAAARLYGNLPLMQSQLSPAQDGMKKGDSAPIDLSPTNKGAPPSALSNNKPQKSSSTKINTSKAPTSKLPNTYPKVSSTVSSSPKNISGSLKVSQANNIAPPTSEVTITKLPNTSESPSVSPPIKSINLTPKSTNTNTISITKRPISTSTSNNSCGKFGVTRSPSNASVRQIPNPSLLSHQSEVRNSPTPKPITKPNSPVNAISSPNNNNNNTMVKVEL